MAQKHPHAGRHAMACTGLMLGLLFCVSVTEVQARQRRMPDGGVILAQLENCSQPAGDNQRPLFRPRSNLCLLQPLDESISNPGTTSINMAADENRGIGAFFTYFNLAWPWLIGIAAGFAVLQAVVGGIQIMISGGAEQKGEGQTRLTWALGGLLLVVLAAAILRILNPIFYQ